MKPLVTTVSGKDKKASVVVGDEVWVGEAEYIGMPIFSVSSHMRYTTTTTRVLWFEVVDRKINPLNPPDPSFAEFVLAEMLWEAWLLGPRSA